MALLRRRQGDSGDLPPRAVEGVRLSRQARRKQLEREKLDATPPWQTPHHGELAETSGPFDVSHAPDDGRTRVDLGGLRVPVIEGAELRMDTDVQGEVVGITVLRAGSQMQLGLFAAPRAEGIWDEVRAELVDSIREGGGNSRQAKGRFGTELHGELASGRGKATPVRFIGVDGPRWFLRAMLVGPAATDPEAAKPLEDLMQATVVVRGRDPLPVRDPVPLHLPKDASLGDDSSPEPH